MQPVLEAVRRPGANAASLWEDFTSGRVRRGERLPRRAASIEAAIDVETYELSVRDEVLVVDERAALSPAEMVERKLLSLLGASPFPVSQLRTTFLRTGRGRNM